MKFAKAHCFGECPSDDIEALFVYRKDMSHMVGNIGYIQDRMWNIRNQKDFEEGF